MTSSPPDGRGSSAIAVGVYDEPELIVSGVRGLFTAHGGRAVVRPLADARATGQVDVLLCDPIDRDLEVEEYLERAATLTSAPIVAFSWSTRSRHVRRALAAGARGYVSKRSGGRELLDTVEAVHRGEAVSPRIESDDRLSGRESDVLHLICQGMSNDEIAAALFVSVNSVKTYIRQIYAKIEVNRRAQAVAWGIARGY